MKMLSLKIQQNRIEFDIQVYPHLQILILNIIGKHMKMYFKFHQNL